MYKQKVPQVEKKYKRKVDLRIVDRGLQTDGLPIDDRRVMDCRWAIGLPIVDSIADCRLGGVVQDVWGLL